MATRSGGIAPVLRAVTYNVHGCVGIDGHPSVEHVAALLAEIGADVVALQEVFRHGPPREDQAGALARRLGMHLAFAEARRHHEFTYGNVLLSRSAPARVEARALPAFPASEPRVALEAVFAAPRLTVVTTHLGLRRDERFAQAVRLAKLLPAEGPVLVLGDFNCGPRDAPVRALTRLAGLSPMPRRPRTFPSWMPMRAIDFALGRDLRFHAVRSVRSWRARIGSDHLPVVVDVSPQV